MKFKKPLIYQLFLVVGVSAFNQKRQQNHTDTSLQKHQCSRPLGMPKGYAA